MSRKSVALLIETSNAYARGLLQGVTAYQRQHEAWSIWLPEQERAARPPAWLKNWKGDGIIARIETRDMAAALKRLAVPVVDVSAARHVPGIPWVETDDEAVSRLAFDHLRERGFRTVGFCGDPAFNWSQWRGEAFQKYAAAAGVRCEVFQWGIRSGGTASWGRERKRMVEWIRKLPRPIGILTCYDIMAQRLLDACRDVDVNVPEDVAVLGVDNDQLLCDLATPSLSSVQLDAHRTGYTASELLARMMSGQRVPPERHLIPPLGVATRNSTNTLAIDDPDLIAAWKYMREQAFQGIDVGDVLKQVPLTRRALETRFQKVVGRTPHQELVRLRIVRVRELLRETDMTLAEIAQSAGFAHTEYLSVAFKKAVGQTPREYRRAASAR